ncbi:MAG: photosystem II reaction center PsbP family protein [Pseudanabaenales cyanobacterium]|nr:photosystem II reaction center PsbP family protein [Pseudanabaenales cyanobacterium]
MLKRIAALLLVIIALSLQGCVSATVGLQSYADNYDGYSFLYPTGWVPVTVSDGPDVVFRDIINATENVSVVMSPVSAGKTLEDLGSPTEVGYKLSKSINALTDSNRDVQLVNAEAVESGELTYYILEYVANLPAGIRHNLASVIVRRGQLFTFNASTPEDRWSKIGEVLRQSVESFSVY